MCMDGAWLCQHSNIREKLFGPTVALAPIKVRELRECKLRPVKIVGKWE